MQCGSPFSQKFWFQTRFSSDQQTNSHEAAKSTNKVSYQQEFHNRDKYICRLAAHHTQRFLRIFTDALSTAAIPLHRMTKERTLWIVIQETWVEVLRTRKENGGHGLTWCVSRRPLPHAVSLSWHLPSKISNLIKEHCTVGLYSECRTYTLQKHLLLRYGSVNIPNAEIRGSL
jgi:hypothetical protein